jgi:hypothetical protein
VTYTYLHPLRNALTDLRPGRSNRLVSLLKSTIGVDAYGEVGPDGKLDRILARLRTLAGDLDPLELAENGLGYNNILYMATLLAGLDKEPDGELHLLLVEQSPRRICPLSFRTSSPATWNVRLPAGSRSSSPPTRPTSLPPPGSSGSPRWPGRRVMASSLAATWRRSA